MSEKCVQLHREKEKKAGTFEAPILESLFPRLLLCSIINSDTHFVSESPAAQADKQKECKPLLSLLLL